MMGICQHSLFVGLVASLSLMDAASAGLMVSAIDTSTRIGFDGYRGDGLVPNPSPTQLDSDYWRITGLSDGAGAFGGTFSTGDFARGSSSGGVTSGGIYGFDVGSVTQSNWALGFQPIGSDLTPGAATLMITNATGMVVDRLDLAYQVWLRNDGDRSSTFRFAYSLDDLNYRLPVGLQVTSSTTADVMPGWIANDRATRLSGLSLASGSSIFLQWQLDDLSGSGSRDEWALDNIDFTLGRPAINTVPEPSSWMMIALLCPTLVWHRRRQLPWLSRSPLLNETEKVIRRRLSASIESIPIA